MSIERSHLAAKLACTAIVALAYFVAAITVIMNVRYGQKMSVDADGWWLNGGYMLAISIGPALLSTLAGATSKRFWSGLLLVAAVAFSILSVWNALSFFGDQILGKAKLSEMQARNAKNIAEIQNDTTLQERADTRRMLMTTYVAAKSEQAKTLAMGELKGITDRPVALVAPSVEIAVADARTELAQKVLGWDRTVINGASVLGIPIVMALIELTFPLIGFKLWPAAAPQNDRAQLPSANAPLRETFRILSKAEARDDLLGMIARSEPLTHGQALARRWGVREGTASRWLSDFRREGLIERKQSGVRKIVLARVAPPMRNGGAVAQ